MSLHVDTQPAKAAQTDESSAADAFAVRPIKVRPASATTNVEWRNRDFCNR